MIRQLGMPKEFRIDPPAWPEPTLGLLEEIFRLLQSPPPVSPAAGAAESKEWDRFLADIGTGLWRIRQGVARMAKQQELPKGVTRALDTTWDVFSQSGLEVRGHDREIVVGGESFRIITWQPTPGLAREQVIETIRPSIYYRDRLIQAGEVIAGRPEGNGADAGSSERM